FALDLSTLPDDCGRWRAVPTTRENAGLLFSGSGYDLAKHTGQVALLLRDREVAGYAAWKHPEQVPSFYFPLPCDAAYLNFAYLAPEARCGEYRLARRALCHHLRESGARWIVSSCNDWNEKVIRACARAG